MIYETKCISHLLEEHDLQHSYAVCSDAKSNIEPVYLQPVPSCCST